MRQSAWKGGSITNIPGLSNLNGFIDLHTHGIGRYDTRTAAPEDILRIAELHAKAGTAAFLPTIYAGPVHAMRQNMEAVGKAMEIQKAEEIQDSKKFKVQNPKSKINPPDVVHGSSLILGVHLEGPFLNPVRCGALDRDYFIRPALSFLARLTEGYEGIIKIITIAPEIPGALRVIERCAEMGIRVNMGHSDATCKEAENGKKAGATGITHIFNAMRPFHHREPGLAGFGLSDRDTYIEVIADGVHLHPETLKIIFSAKKPDRIMLVSDSVKGGGRQGKPLYTADDRLAGSGIAIRGSLDVLKRLGIPPGIMLEAGTNIPCEYLGNLPL